MCEKCQEVSIMSNLSILAAVMAFLSSTMSVVTSVRSFLSVVYRILSDSSKDKLEGGGESSVVLIMAKYGH